MSHYFKNKGPLIFAGIGAAGIGYWVYNIGYPSVSLSSKSARECMYGYFGVNEADGYTVKKIEEAYRKLQQSEECHSLLKKHFTESVKDKLKYKKTKLGGTLYDVIRSGVANLDSGVGVYAPDAESYKKFAALFDPIIDDYHGGFGPNAKHPATYFGEDKLSELQDLDPEGKYILSTRIRCGRSFKGYPFNPLLSRDDYLSMQSKVQNVFDGLKSDSELGGTYYPLEGMTKETQTQLIADHFLFKEGDRFLKEANANRFWPTGRGIFHNAKKDFSCLGE
ncbi:Arginine kinase [Meloidogyne graminicola]|uniref:arginine kinase n=1 Tax=Meloidogyne graminicola TaxID=189291 RepID=A0A8S9ZJ05_9BILA|nr:Arginine kinase [Meloidogyne graminicola]